MAGRTLDGMALGGMHDVLGGGFHRYSVDGHWLVPHFEKMLYDNALLAVAYLEGWAVTGNAAYRRVAEGTLDYMLRELRRPEGGFASAQDADTDGEEGATFVWTPDQVREVLGPDDAAAAIRYFGISEAGNFEGASILRPVGEPPENLDAIERRLLEVRRARPQPALDDKVLAAWNGLALAALAQGARRLGRADLLEAGRALAGFLEERMRAPDGGLLRTFRAGQARIPGYLDDHAAVAHGLLELHLASGEAEYLRRARELAGHAAERFADPAAGGFFQSAGGGGSLVAPRKDLEDNPIPSGQFADGDGASAAGQAGGRRRARGAGARRHPPLPRLRAAGASGVRPCCFRRSTWRSAPAARGRRRRRPGRSGHRGAARRRPGGVPPDRRRTPSGTASGAPPAALLSRAGRWSTAGPRRTSASGSRASAPLTDPELVREALAGVSTARRSSAEAAERAVDDEVRSGCGWAWAPARPQR